MKPIASTRFDSSPHPSGARRNEVDAATPSRLQQPDGLASRTAALSISDHHETDELPQAWLDRRRSERLEELQTITEAAAARKSQVDPAEHQLAGYVLGREGDGRPLPESDIARLRTAGPALGTTCLLLDHGRGNVDADIEYTNRESRYRTGAAKGLVQQWDATHLMLTADPVVNHEAKRAAAAMAFQAGNCREHASVAALAYARFAMRDGRPADEVVDVVGGSRHNWAEVRGRTAGEDAVVIDPWAEGTPVMAEDSRFGKDRSKVQQGPGMRIGSAAQGFAQARAAAARYVKQEPADVQHRLASERTLRHGENLKHPSAGIWSPQPVLDDEFSQRALAKLNGHEQVPRRDGQEAPADHSVRQAAHDVQVELKALEIARKFGSDGGVADLRDDAAAIVGAARELLSGRPQGPG